MAKKESKTATEPKTETEKKTQPEAVKVEAPAKTEAPVAVETPAPTTGEKADEKALRAKLKDGYERFTQKVASELRERGKVGKKQWEEALKTAKDFVQKSKPELKREDLEKLGDGIKKDVRAALRTIKSRGDDFTKSEAFLTARDKGAEFLLKIAHAVKDAAESVETNLGEVLKYKKGDVVGGGQLVCNGCKETVTVESGPLAACPKCGNEEFKRKS